MELIGKIVKYRETGDGLRLIFRCCNKEVFDLKFPKILDRIPSDVTVRVWTERPVSESGTLRKENVVVYWEKPE